MRTLERDPATPPGRDDIGPGRSPGRGRTTAPPGRPPALVPALAPALAELSLALVTIASVAGLTRLFADASFLPPVVGAALAGHVVAGVTRRRGMNPLAAAALSGVGLVLFVTWVVEPHTTTLGLPGAGTWEAVAGDLRGAWERFGAVVAPAPVTRGFVLAGVVGAWLAASLGDLFAFRVRARFEAVVPSFTVFLFGAMLGTDRNRIGLTALYLAAVLAFVVLADAGIRSTTGSWFGTRGAQGDGAVLRAAAVVGLAAVTAAVVLGPRLPGADSAGLFGLGDKPGSRGSARVTVSPLVDIRGRLVNPSGAEVFTVGSAAPAYWRLTSLDRFDGSIWSSKGSYQRARGSLPDGVATTGAEEPLSQDFTIGALSAIWLPAAFRPERVGGEVPGLRYERDSASLLTARDTADGLRYTVDSALPRITAEELAAAPGQVPPAVAERYLSLPADFPESVTAQAQEVMGNQPTPFAKARALQDWFRTNFAYSLDVAPGHSGDAIVRFLEQRVGYCEQFAGSFAAMARVVGLPSRVAVGFTPGVLGDDGRYHVTDQEAHAWPEVYIAGYGWVAFEPTPGRAQPGTEDYTDVSPAEPEQPSAPDTTVAAVPTPAPGAEGEATPPPPTEQPATTEADEPGPSLLRRLVQASLVLALLLPVAAVAAVPLVRQAVRRRRRLAATTPAQRVLVAWDEAEDDLAATGLGRQRWETAAEYTARVGPVGGETVSRHLGVLTADAEAAAWSGAGVEPAVADRAEETAAALGTALRADATPLRRTLWAIDPRPLLRNRRP
jgi:transglutaminase-like putative cysteine protease